MLNAREPLKRKPLPDRVEELSAIDIPSGAVLIRRFDAKGKLIHSHFELRKGKNDR